MPARLPPFVLVVPLVLSAPALAQKDEPSAETRAIIKTAREYLKGKKVEDRIKGVGMLGELGGKAMTARRDLCEAMLDKETKVRVAAIDAMKLVDKEMAELALSIGKDLNFNSLILIAAKKEDAEPLTPLVLVFSKLVAEGKVRAVPDDALIAGRFPDFPREPVSACIFTLATIAPDDEAANAAVVSGLTSKDEGVLLTAIQCCTEIKSSKTSAKQLTVLAQKGAPKVRPAAIRALVAVADETTERAIYKLLDDMRFDSGVRDDVEAAKKELKAKFEKK